MGILTEWIRRINHYPILKSKYDKLLKDSANSKSIDVSNAAYWNDKWKKSIVYYAAPTKKKVTSYVVSKNLPFIVKLAKDFVSKRSLTSARPDEIPIAVLKWLHAKFASDTFSYKLDSGEQWYTPAQTLKQRFGDCDDWGILSYYIIRGIFVELGTWKNVRHRLKCVAGNVNYYGQIPHSAGAHFYLNWLHSNGYWYTIESTYHRDKSISHYGKLPQKLNPAYGTIWFTFNEQYSWAQHSLVVSKEDFRKL